MKKTICLLLIILILIVAGCSSQKKEENAEPEKPAEERTDDIYIFYTSDVHCGVEENLRLASVKSLVDETKAEHEYVTLVDLGDFLQGDTLGSLSNGRLIIDIMNKMEYDFATVGNHEFDYGMEELGQRLSEADFQVIASNVIYTGSTKNIFEDIPEFVIRDYGGTKVAFLGVLTPQSIVSSTPKYFMEGDEYVYDFYSGNNGQDLYDKVQSLTDEARAQGAEYVIVLSHLGSDIYGIPYDSVSLISHTTGIDAVLDGHSHSVIIGDAYPNKDGEDVILSSVGTKLQALGELIIGTDGSITTLHIDQYDKQDEAILESIAAANAEIESVLGQKICDLDFDLPITDEEGIRMTRARETTVGDFAADAIRYVMNTDIGLVNGGGVRSAIEAGDVTAGDLVALMPFRNEIYSVRASGQQIIDALEYCSRKTEALYKFDGNAVGEYGAFLQVSGLRYTIDTSIESQVTVDGNGMFSGYSGEERRVSDVMVLKDGEYVPIDPEAFYTVAGTDYILFDGGDGNTAFQGAERVSGAGVMDIDALMTYLKEQGGFSDSYRETDNRITIK